MLFRSLPVGLNNYVLAGLPFHQRLFLHLAGIAGDKPRGIQQLEQTAGHGHLLKPFARIVLALIAAHEKDLAHARKLLEELQQEFPLNTIFPKELSRLGGMGGGEGQRAESRRQ